MKRLIGILGLSLAMTTVLAAPLPQKVLEAKVKDAMQDHAELNATYWKGDKMDPDVRAKLTKMGQDYFDDLQKKLPNIKLQDILFSGSLANYNYTKSSDIDVHVVVDTSKVSCDKRVVSGYIMLMNKYEHETANLSVFDTPLQISLSTSAKETGGAYSLLNATWLNKPVHPKPTYTKRELTEQVETYHLKITELQEAYTKNPATFDCERAKALSYQLGNGRTAGLKRDGYSSIENNLYRILRSVGDLKILREIKKQCKADEA
jgi:hypothetical protein